MYPYSKREGVAIDRADWIVAKLRMNQFKYPDNVADPLNARVFHSFIEDHAHEPPRGAKYHEQYQHILNLWKEHNMTPLQAATNKRDTLIAERDSNRDTIAEYESRVSSYAVRNAAITTEIIGLSATISAEERKEREAKHKQMADELTAAGYKVGPPVRGHHPIMFGLHFGQGFKRGDLIAFGAPTNNGVSCFYDAIREVYGSLQMYNKDTGKPAGTLETALSGGGKAPGMNTPGAGAGSAQPITGPVPKLGGVHGEGEGWYRPVVYGSNGVKLEHDFAINTRDHHEARNKVWLKHVPSGSITKGFPNEQEAHRWVRARTATHGKEFGKMAGVPEWHPHCYPGVK